MNLAITKIPQLVYFGDDVRWGATLLSPPRKRHDAISAELVTPFDNRNKGDVLRSARRSREVPLFALRTLVQIYDSAFAIQRPANQFRQAISGARAGYDIYRRTVIEDALAFELRHAPHDADNGVSIQSLASDF